jgi:hypothetical protein
MCLAESCNGFVFNLVTSRHTYIYTDNLKNGLIAKLAVKVAIPFPDLLVSYNGCRCHHSIIRP